MERSGTQPVVDFQPDGWMNEYCCIPSRRLSPVKPTDCQSGMKSQRAECWESRSQPHRAERKQEVETGSGNPTMMAATYRCAQFDDGFTLQPSPLSSSLLSSLLSSSLLLISPLLSPPLLLSSLLFSSLLFSSPFRSSLLPSFPLFSPLFSSLLLSSPLLFSPPLFSSLLLSLFQTLY